MNESAIYFPTDVRAKITRLILNPETNTVDTDIIIKMINNISYCNLAIL